MSNRLESEERGRAEGIALGYLENVCSEISLHEYESVRGELMAHLVELATAYEELGFTSSEAMRMAIAKLGSAKPLGAAIAAQDAPARQANSSWLAVLCGGATSMGAMTLSDLLIWRLGIVSNPGGIATCLLGMAMGLVAGVFAVRSRSSAAFKAVVTGLVFGPGLLAVVSFLNQRPPSFELAISCSLLFGLSGAATCFSASLAAKVFARLRLERARG